VTLPEDGFCDPSRNIKIMTKLKSSFLHRPPSGHQIVTTSSKTLMASAHNISTVTSMSKLLQSEIQVPVNVSKLLIPWFCELDKKHIKSFHQERLFRARQEKKNTTKKNNNFH